MLKLFKNYFDTHALKDDCRKLSINFITAGFVGAFFTNASSLRFPLFIAALVVILTGVAILLLSLFRRNK